MLNQIVYASGTPTAIGHWDSGSPVPEPVEFTAGSGAPSPFKASIPPNGQTNGLIRGTKVIARARVRVDLVGATFSGGQTLTLELCSSTGGTATLIPNSASTFVIPACTTTTKTLFVGELPAVKLMKLAGTEDIILYATLSAAPSAGSIEVVEASLEIDLA